MRIVYCDDDTMSCKIFEKFTEKYASSKNISIEQNIIVNPLRFISEVIDTRTRYDVYFLDIVMPGYSGIELATRIREYDRDGIIIFITGSSEYFREAYALEAIQYLEKPMVYNDVERCYDRASNILENTKKKTISLRLPKGLKTVDISEIVYVESFLHVLKIHLGDNTEFETANSSITLSKLAEMLQYPNFYMVSRSCILNFDYVEHIDGEDLVIKKHRGRRAYIKIPSKQVARFKENYKEYMDKK